MARRVRADANANYHVPPPDGGWGWMVVLASFVLQMVSMGTTLSFGVLFTELLDYFNATETTTSWIGSIQPAMLYLTGLIAAPMNQKLGWRCVAALGAIISTVGFGLSSLVPNIYWLYITYGLITGIGNGFMYMTSMIVVQHYFERRRALATGLVVSGSGLGTSVFGVVNDRLLRLVGWRYTMLALAGMSLTCALFALLYRPLPQPEHLPEEADKLVTDPPPKGYGSVRPPNGHIVPDSVSPEPPSIEDNGRRTGCCSPCCRSSCMGNLFDCSLCRNPVFVLYTLAVVLFFFGYHVPYTYIPVRAEKEFGIDKADASFLVSIMGISSVGSRLVFGSLADRSRRIRFYMSGAVLTLGGVISITIFLFNTYTLMIIYCILFGAFTGCRASLLPVVLVDLLGIEVVDKAIGLSFAAASFSYLLASPLSGMIIDNTANFDAPFMVFGGAETVGGLIYFCILCIKPSKRYETITERYIEST